MHLKNVFCVVQMSDEILVLSVKEQKLKHWSGCTCTHKRVPFLSTPGCLFFLFFLGSNSLKACVPYLCKQTTGKSKEMAPPNLCVQACHTSSLKQRRGPWALPLTHRRRDFPPQAVFTQKTGSAKPDVVGSAGLQSWRTERQNLRKPTVSSFTSAENDRFHWCSSLLQPNFHWLMYTGVCFILVCLHSTLPLVLNFTLLHLCNFVFQLFIPI